jgi:uncharacterized protein YkwD
MTYRGVTLVAAAALALAVACPATEATGATGRHRPHRHHHYHGHRHRHRQRHRRRASAHRATACLGADTPATQASRAAMRAAVVCLVNAQREARGLPAFVVDPRLNESAQRWTDHLVATDQFLHGDFAGRIGATGYDWSWAGENLATGFPTPRSVVTAWMASADHCRNILSPDYANVGTGLVAKDVPGYSSGPSTWGQDFGSLMGAPEPSANGRAAAGCPYRV